MNWAEFFNMGGYAFEVWTSWGLTLTALILFVVIPKLRHANIKSRILRQIRREQRQQSK